MRKILSKIKSFYHEYFKHHCPECDGVMDSNIFDLTQEVVVYKCRNCGKEWI